MRFEDILPALREGKKVRRKEWCVNGFIYKDGNFIRCHDNSLFYGSYILNDDWEIYELPKKKVKYYPALFKFKNGEFYLNNNKRYRYVEEAKEDGLRERINILEVRLITEVPELIEEREE